MALPTGTPPAGTALPPTGTPPAGTALLGPGETTQQLSTAIIPPRSLISLTQWLKLKSAAPLPATVNATPPHYQVGARHAFWVSDQQARSYYTVTAELKIVTDHAYWYVADGDDISTARSPAIGGSLRE